MNGSAIQLAGKLYLVTDPALWQACKTEDEYFTILRDRQRKGGENQSLIIAETQEEQQVPGSLF